MKQRSNTNLLLVKESKERLGEYSMAKKSKLKKNLMLTMLLLKELLCMNTMKRIP
jgi:hypothetical protein